MTIHTEWNKLSPPEKGRPLELVFFMLCLFYKNKFGCSYSNLTCKDHRNDKAKYVLDFILNHVLVELKNWNCYTQNGYTIEKRDIDNQILPKFEGYPNHLKKILMIGKPNWGKGAKEYLKSKGIIIVEIGFQVKNNDYDLMKAYHLLKKEIGRIIGITHNYTSRCRLDENADYDPIDEEIYVLDLLLDELNMEPG